jgi:tetratricopeptide (TPR) repeat protein
VKPFIYCIIAFSAFACKNKKPLAEPFFVDSLLASFTPSNVTKTNEADLNFWKNRVQNMAPSFVNQQKYAQALAARFHIYGDIRDLRFADSIIRDISRQYKEPGFFLSLAAYQMLQHRFREAKSYIDTVLEMKAERYATQMMLFDVDFETGKHPEANTILRNNVISSDYAYNFRMSKKDHYEGKVDEAIAHMLNAADLAGSNVYLRQAALSNAADLYIHDGKPKKAAALFHECIRMNSCDFHSILGLGWLALTYDRNDSIAMKLFEFVRKQVKSPEPLLKLALAVEIGHPELAKKYAEDFAREATQPVYGNMYNKYLVQLYTGILADPSKAVGIARREVTYRATPQTYAWLAWSLFSTGQLEDAYNIYQTHVSRKPLEGLELYYMGKLMKGLGKAYNARQFFMAAEKNKYDLSPVMKEDLEDNL